VGVVDAGRAVVGATGVGWFDDGAKGGRAVVVRVVTERGAVLDPPSVTSDTTKVAVTIISTRATTITAVTKRISRQRSEAARAGERPSTAGSDAGPTM